MCGEREAMPLRPAMTSHQTRRARAEAKAFDERHLVALRPLKISKRGRQERFIFPELHDLVGTSFELCPDELRFLYRLLGGAGDQGLRRHNLWVYRADQKKLAGDFVIIDVSRPPRQVGALKIPRWEVFVLDLKMNGELRLDGGGAGNQLMNWAKAAAVAQHMTARRLRLLPDEPGERKRWHNITQPSRIWRMSGDRQCAIDFLCGA